MLSLKILGCGDAFNSGGRRHTSFLLETTFKYKILIGCGATTGLAFKLLEESFEDVDCIILTHFHGDHYGGLPYLILDAAKVSRRTKQLIIVSPPGLEEKLQQLLRLLYPGSEDSLKAFPIKYISFTAETQLELPFGQLTAYPVNHSEQIKPHGLRLSIGEKVFAYSGDTSWHDNLIKLANDADLFICECNFYKTASPAHLNYKTLLKKIDFLSCKKMMLTHLGEEMLKNGNKIKLEILSDGQQIEF